MKYSKEYIQRRIDLAKENRRHALSLYFVVFTCLGFIRSIYNVDVATGGVSVIWPTLMLVVTIAFAVFITKTVLQNTREIRALRKALEDPTAAKWIEVRSWDGLLDVKLII